MEHKPAYSRRHVHVGKEARVFKEGEEALFKGKVELY